MGKGFFSSAKSYAKNIGKHVGWLIVRREGPRQAMRGLAQDSKKLGRSLKRATTTGDHDEAIRLVRKGRELYNGGLFEDAERVFRDAVRADKHCALAYTYLGHALYKQERVKAAVTLWNKAIDAAPGSDAAEKARRKIAMVDGQKRTIKKWVEERLEK